MSKRNCKVCGRLYNYCPTCDADKNKPRWYNNFDCENCKDIWAVLVRHGSGEISAEKATDMILELDLEGLDNFNEPVRKHINDLLDGNNECEECKVDSEEE